jgi:hypothetical protein
MCIQNRHFAHCYRHITSAQLCYMVIWLRKQYLVLGSENLLTWLQRLAFSPCSEPVQSNLHLYILCEICPIILPSLPRLSCLLVVFLSKVCGFSPCFPVPWHVLCILSCHLNGIIWIMQNMNFLVLSSSVFLIRRGRVWTQISFIHSFIPLFVQYFTPLWFRYSLINSFFIHSSLEWWSKSFS